MFPRRTTAIVIAMVALIAGCQSVAVSPSSETTPPQPEPGASVESSQPDAGPTIDPDWVTRPVLTCGDPHPLFPPEALGGIGLSELGLDPAAAVLRSTIADTPDYLPDSGWHRVAENADGVMFVAAGNDETPWFEVTVGLFDGTLQAIGMGQCTLAIAAPKGVTFARWWLDSDAPPPTAGATQLAILLREQDCASGKPPEGRVLPPTIVLGATAILVAIGIRELANADCPYNPAHPMELVLPEAIGSRGLFDASQYPPRPVTSEDPG